MRTPAPCGGRAILFVAAGAQTDGGVIARTFAEEAAARAERGVWLLDLDFSASRQFARYAALGGDRAPGAARDARFGAAPFWRLAGEARGEAGPEPAALLAAHRIGASTLHVSRFDPAAAQGRRVQVGPQPAYWAAARSRLDLIVVDAPGLARSRAALALAADMDAVVLIVDAQADDPNEVVLAQQAIETRGGRCLGMVLTNAPSTIGWGG